MKERPIPEIKNIKDLKKYIKPLYVIEDYTSSYDDYNNFQEGIYAIIKGCFEHKECREYPVNFKFYRNDKSSYTLELRRFIINVFAWYPFVSLDGLRVLDESFILHPEDIPNITKYYNKKIIRVLRDYNIKNTRINYDVSESLFNMRRISIDFSLILNLNIETETFLSMYNENERIRQIMHTKFPDDMQPADLEHELNAIMEEEISIYKNHPTNHVGVLLRANTGVKHKQLAEMTINGGLQPSLTGETITLPINSNMMIGGLNTPSTHFIGANGARKSLVSNKKVMGKAGYFGKIVLLLARTLSLSKTESDCNTKHLIRIHIGNAKILNKYNGRYYKLTDDDNLKVLNSETDKDLIGKTIFLRSPITCACKNRDEVCHKCFGTTSLLNLDIADGVSGFEAEEVTKVVNQMILSTKHLLTTRSEKIEFNENFYKFFTLASDEILVSFDNDEIDYDDYAILIGNDDLKKIDDLDSDSSFNTYVDSRFFVKNLRTKKLFDIVCENDKELYLTDDALELLKKGKGMIKFKDLSDDFPLFELVIMNNELTKPLYDLMDLLNKNNRDKIDFTIHDMAQTFTELLVNAGISASALAGELIINRLIREDPDDNFQRPDFSEDEVPPYQIYTVAKALESNSSPLIGWSFQNLQRQLLSDDLITKKHGTSYLDPFFMKKLPNKLYHENSDN